MRWRERVQFLCVAIVICYIRVRVILAFHCIFSTYGFWLPNEPRGSWSSFVGSWELFRHGPATTVRTRRSLAHVPYDRDLKRQMRSALRHDPVCLTGEQALVCARAFASAPYTLHALAIMPDHDYSWYRPGIERRILSRLGRCDCCEAGDGGCDAGKEQRHGLADDAGDGGDGRGGEGA
jgi:hypothetical protein